ncbi:hypothetical protein [Alteromonas sp. CYL-A6]|uniref:hypothetical protein n=1 Tax=Alteromonas nitratireducens TaxID=3390813 RepID=UPI0034B31FF8
MSKPLIYIDQNVIGLQLQGSICLSSRNDLVWVYSKEHFAEIRRADNPETYLNVLEEIDAKLLELVLDESFRITDKAVLNERDSPHHNYSLYIETTKEVKFDETIFDPFQVWVNGGDDGGLLKDLPDKLVREIAQLTSGLSFETSDAAEKVLNIKPEFDSLITDIISNGNDINKTRAALGDIKGTIGSISGDKEIMRIWEIISPTMSTNDITCDQFFGFDPVDKQSYLVWPMYLGIVGCNAVLDILGFQAEKKCRKLNKIHNVRSDASHMAMAAFCSAVISEDKRFIRRASAIYNYKNIDTISILMEKSTNE